MSDKLQELKDGKYQQKWVAERLYPGLQIFSAMAKLNSKLRNKQNRKLTEAEIKQIENICK